METMNNLGDYALQAGSCGAQLESDPFHMKKPLRREYRSDITHRWIHFDLPVACILVEFGEFGCTCEEFVHLGYSGKWVTLVENCLVDVAGIQAEATVPIWLRYHYLVGYPRSGDEFLQHSVPSMSSSFLKVLW